jgi:hypothetical protein
LGLTHYIYLITIAIVIFLMIKKQDVVIVCLVGTVVLASVYNKSLVGGVQTLFNALIVAGTDLFDIMLVISIMVAMLKSISQIGADKKMFAPLKGMIKTPTSAYFLLGGAAYIAASLFWPTPATALVGPLLIPVCIEAGLPALAAAMAFNIFGHGMGLSGDLVIQGALKLSATSAGIDIDSMFVPSAILSLTCGLVAGIVGYLIVRRDFKSVPVPVKSAPAEIKEEAPDSPFAVFFAILVPVAFLLAIIIMVVREIRGGDATALIGGTGALILAISTIMCDGKNCFEKSVSYMRDGFMYGIKIFAPVIPIAAFFFLGGPAAPDILGEGAPSLLFDIGQKFYELLPLGKIPLGFGNAIIGVITGLDGSGFSGLPLTGSMAAAFGNNIGANVAALAGIGQVGAIWAGGGTLVPWCFGLAATAGVAGVSPVELARKNFIPVCCGLLASTVVGILLM